MAVTITGQYANLSRGRISAKHVKTGQWAERGAGTVILDQPGKWMISQTDGFNRKETVYVIVSDDCETVADEGRNAAFGSRSKFSVKYCASPANKIVQMFLSELPES